MSNYDNAMPEQVPKGTYEELYVEALKREQAANYEIERLRKANQDCVAWEKACKADLDRALARVAELEEGLAGIENCAFGYQGCRQTAEEAADWMNAEATRLLEGTNGAHTLRKQAEVLERLMDGAGVHTHETVTGEGISTDEIWDYAQSLRQQADQMEADMGEVRG